MSDEPLIATPPKPVKRRRRPLPPLMITAKLAARMFSVSLRTWRSLDSAGKVPMPTRLGGRVLWHLPELRQWAAAGCPNRTDWNLIKRQGKTER